MRVRDATDDDVAAIVDITNDVISTTDAIWVDDPVDGTERRRWLHGQQEAGHPVLVAETDDGQVIGYGTYSRFRTKAGYWPTVEHTIHLAADHRGRGGGQAILDTLVERATDDGRHVLVAAIDGGNHGSIRFHERNGFRIVGHLPRVGRKNGHPVDLVMMQRDLQPAPPPPPG